MTKQEREQAEQELIAEIRKVREHLNLLYGPTK